DYKRQLIEEVETDGQGIHYFRRKRCSRFGVCRKLAIAFKDNIGYYQHIVDNFYTYNSLKCGHSGKRVFIIQRSYHQISGQIRAYEGAVLMYLRALDLTLDTPLYLHSRIFIG
ncbi:hypothetical protein ACJX0J_034052, partial [Zea mays]